MTAPAAPELTHRDPPVAFIPTDDPDAGVEAGTALCLSGGGYRAMVFHTGALWRLYEAGRLADLKRISSVSGGSITAGVLALAWKDLSFDPDRLEDDFVPRVVAPLRKLASTTIDVGSVLLGAILPGGVSGRVEKAYAKHLFGDATLQHLPDAPSFVINATNLQSGALWRFMKREMADWRVGSVGAPTLPLARAVAASSAFPPVLSPLVLKLDPAAFTPQDGKGLHTPAYRKRVVLADGGVYDNLGLETAYKRYRTILVSDAGGHIEPDEKPKSGWLGQSYRVGQVMDSQVRSLRKRQVIGAFEGGRRDGVYWGIRTDIANYETSSALDCPHERTLILAREHTRLAKLKPRIQKKLINWGYAVCDAALRAHVDPQLPEVKQFPYSDVAV